MPDERPGAYLRLGKTTDESQPYPAYPTLPNDYSMDNSGPAKAANADGPGAGPPQFPPVPGARNIKATNSVPSVVADGRSQGELAAWVLPKVASKDEDKIAVVDKKDGDGVIRYEAVTPGAQGN